MQNETNDSASPGVLSARREFLKRVFATSAYAGPVVMSFAAQDLVRAASWPSRHYHPDVDFDNERD
jgi:hypothetical protein